MKRWPGCVVLLAVVAWSSPALATLSASPSPVDVGEVAFTSPTPTTGSVNAEIRSDGTDNLDDFSFSGADCPQFNLIATPRSITIATPLSITVEFTPIRRGLATCTVTMLAPNSSSLGTFEMRGTGVAAVIAAPAAQSFGSVRFDNGATTFRDIVIENLGDTGFDLAITDLAISGTHAGDFTITNPPALPAAVAASDSLTVRVTFDPGASGMRSASLDITSDDPATPSVAVALTGEGTNAVIAVTDAAFGDVTNGTTALADITVSNTGAPPVGTLRVTSATIAGGSWFTFDANGSGCLGQTTCGFGGGFNVTASTTVGVRCSPPANAVGMQSATVTFTSDSDSGGDNISNLSCEAGRPDIMVSTTTLAFGDVLINNTQPNCGLNAPCTVVVSNTGNRDLVFTATKSPNSGLYTLAGCVTSCTVAPSAMESFTVSFRPTAPGNANIAIDLNTNDPDPADDPVEIAVTGRGIAPSIAAPGSLALGTVEVGKTSAPPTVLTITNNGTAPLNISSVAISSNALEFSIMTGTIGAQVVAAGNQASWGIVCHPQQHGLRSGQFRINSDAFNGAIRNVTLNCTGEQGVLATNLSSHDFGGVAQGDVATQPVTLRNTGNVAVSGITAVFSPNNVGYSIDPNTPVPAMLGAGESSPPINILFSPDAGIDGGPATLTFSGSWGITPTATMAVVNLDGDGLIAGFDVTPAMIDFGDLRYDTTPTRTFCIVNTQEATLAIASISIAPGAGTMTDEFRARATVRRQAVCGTGGTAQTLPETLATGQILEVTVVADPEDRTGMMSAVLTVTSDLDVNPTRTVTLMGNSTSAVVALAPGALVDFGAVDIQGAPATQLVTITNTGNAPLDLTNFTRTSNPRFTFTLPADTTVPPAGNVAFPVTYTPTVARAAGSEETVTINHGIAGAILSPSSQMIVLRGRGIDRDLVLGPTPTFPDTFRNPGTDGPVRGVMVTNPGEAPLSVSAVMITNDIEVWQLLDVDPVVIPGGANHEFRVRFEPKAAGPAPEARLQLVNDDDDDGPPVMTKITEVVLVGNGVDRDVAFNPTVVDLGYTAIGVPVSIADALSVTSMDPDTRFYIETILIEGDAGFTIDDPPATTPLEASATRTFTVTFTPEEPGELTARAQLFLDKDHTVHAEVQLRGTAVFVDARGGGGCATGHDLGGGALLLIAALLLRRRRALVGVFVLALIPTQVRAEEDNITLSLFDPTPATTGTGLQLQSAEVGAPGDWAAMTVFSYATDPLVQLASAGGQADVVTRSTLLEIGGAVAFLDRFELGARMPFYSQAGEPERDRLMEYSAKPASGTATGDLSLHGKVRWWRRDLAGGGSTAFATSLQLTLPTAKDGQLTGVDLPTARVLGLWSLVPGAFSNRLSLSVNAGAVLRATAKYHNLEQKSGIAWGLGMAVRTTDRLWLAAEMFGDMVPSGREEVDETAVVLSPIEWLAGLRWRPSATVSVALAAGRGLTSAAGTPALRGVLALTYRPKAAELRPINPPKPDGDEDGDGVRDSADKCGTEAEDLDLFDDADGCPDLDNDHDGVADAGDKCPIDPEDKDGFEDGDGCADKDNDTDGVADRNDKCPDQAEDMDGFLDVDGCPDLDNDRDGLTDAKDKCVSEPETINGNKDNDGCPDRGDSIVVLGPDRIEMLDTIEFRRDKIVRRSMNLLGQIAATLRAHPEIVRMRVTCHVHPSRDYERDQELSDQRAEAVREWLVQWGIEASRVEAKGFGSRKPLAPPEQRGSQQLNDRIELIVLERK